MSNAGYAKKQSELFYRVRPSFVMRWIDASRAVTFEVEDGGGEPQPPNPRVGDKL